MNHRFAISLGHRDLAAADHWILALDPAPTLACTHLVRKPFPHVAISLSTPAPVTTEPALLAGATAAAADRFGRAVLFPGAEQLTGRHTVAAILELSAINRVEILGGGTAVPSLTVDTRGFVRPYFCDGELVLTVLPAAGGVLVPFETRERTPA